MTPERSPLYGSLALFAGAFAVGFSPIFVRLSEVGAVATGAYRVALSLPLLFALLAMRARRQPGAVGIAPADRRRLILAGVLFAGDLAFWHWSIGHTSVANAAFFATFTPVFVAAGAWLVLAERVTPGFVLGLAVSLAGAGFLAGASVNLSPAHLLGDAFGLITAMFFSAYLLAVKPLRRRHSAVSILAWSGTVTAPALLLLAVLLGETILPRSLEGWLVLIALAWLSHAAGQGLVAQALAHLPASFSATALLSEAVFAAILGWVFLAEPVGVLQALGGALVLLGIYLARPRRPTADPVMP